MFTLRFKRLSLPKMGSRWVLRANRKYYKWEADHCDNEEEMRAMAAANSEKCVRDVRSTQLLMPQTLLERVVPTSIPMPMPKIMSTFTSTSMSMPKLMSMSPCRKSCY